MAARIVWCCTPKRYANRGWNKLNGMPWQAGDDVYQPLLKLFTAVEIADLTFAASLMNAFNRLAISMRQ